MSLSILSFETDYRTAQSDLATRFYGECLAHSVRYDRAAGYFSSAVFLIFGNPIINFARRGGKIRLICSPNLTTEDIEAIRSGTRDLGSVSSERLVEELESLLSTPAARDHVRTLATLVALHVLDIRIGVRTSGSGMYHEKMGVFEDADGNAVSFIGSANETWKGWHPEGNYEAIEVFCSWQADAARVAKHRAHFSRLWEGRDVSLQVITFPEALRRKLCETAAQSIDEIALAPEDTQKRPPPRDHQTAAIAGWNANGCRGVFKHATGSGKTMTALYAMTSHLEEGGVAIVLVPSQLLLKQWDTEIRAFFDNPQLLLAGAGNTGWRREGVLRSFSSPDRLLGGRIILATMQTARSDAFISRLKQGPHLLVVADEMHQLGSTENAKFLLVQSGKRLGMSATPERYGDVSGTSTLTGYFGRVIPPEYTLADAIADHHLVPYEYHPQMVTLTEEESDSWRQLTKEISLATARAHASKAPDAALQSRVELLLIQRARIAKKAVRKYSICQDVLKSSYRSGQRWLIYCEDQDQLSKVVSMTRSWCPDVMEYHSSMCGDPVATLQWFQQYGGILVAIACLDEGVNIPSISHALILASSQNPRQFIQRRGRILRKHSTKRYAVIVDALVSPENVDDEPTQRSMLKSELRRALEFSESAMNASAGAALRHIAIQAGIDPDSIDDAGVETEEEVNSNG